VLEKIKLTIPYLIPIAAGTVVFLLDGLECKLKLLTKILKTGFKLNDFFIEFSLSLLLY
jgi:hypothetical protein